MSLIPRIYVDTSVIGGVFDEEFSIWSKKLLDENNKGKNILILSDITLAELVDAPEKVRRIAASLNRSNIEFLSLNDESRALANRYKVEGKMSEKFLFDLQHIAIATVSKADILVSWNFKHIVNMERIHFYNSVNILLGYGLIEIRTPREVVHDQEI